MISPKRLQELTDREGVPLTNGELNYLLQVEHRRVAAVDALHTIIVIGPILNCLSETARVGVERVMGILQGNVSLDHENPS